MLCGFSSRFQLLSPCVRQVTHALLTRPPLSHSNSKLSKCFVRLACVKHAASVHPEPGSNSHVWMFFPFSELSGFLLKSKLLCSVSFLTGNGSKWFFLLFCKDQSLDWNFTIWKSILFEFSGLFSCLIIKVLCCFVVTVISDSSYRISSFLTFVNNFF